MAENDDPTPGQGETAAEPAEPTMEQTAVTSEPAEAEPAQQKFTDRVWNFRAMAAVALAALLLGGGAGAAIAAVSHDDHPDRRGFLRFDGPGGRDGFMGPEPGFGPERRQEFRKNLKEMRREFRDRMKQQYDDRDAPEPPPPSPTPTPNG